MLTLHLQPGVKMGVTLRVYILAYRALTRKTRLHPEHQQDALKSDHHYALCGYFCGIGVRVLVFTCAGKSATPVLLILFISFE